MSLLLTSFVRPSLMFLVVIWLSAGRKSVSIALDEKLGGKSPKTKYLQDGPR